MYQILLLLSLSLLGDKYRLMWVAIELATLTTVLDGRYLSDARGAGGAWKYFILGSVGIALALFGTILVYMAARPWWAKARTGMVWTV